MLSATPRSLRARTQLPAEPSADDVAVARVTVFGSLVALVGHLRRSGWVPTLRPDAGDGALRIVAVLRVRRALRARGWRVSPETLAVAS